MGAGDDLFVGGFQRLRRYRIDLARGCKAATDIVDPFEQDDRLDARHAKYVAVHTCQRVWAGTVAQQTVAADAGIEHRPVLVRRHQAFRQPVRPATEGIGGG